MQAFHRSPEVLEFGAEKGAGQRLRGGGEREGARDPLWVTASEAVAVPPLCVPIQPAATDTPADAAKEIRPVPISTPINLVAARVNPIFIGGRRCLHKVEEGSYPLFGLQILLPTRQAATGPPRFQRLKIQFGIKL